jgi:hypothetical protein
MVWLKLLFVGIPVLAMLTILYRQIKYKSYSKKDFFLEITMLLIGASLSFYWLRD